MSLTLRNSLLFIFVFCFVASTASAQSPSTPPQARQQPTPPPDPADQEQIVAYWTSETGWKSELQLRNNLAAQDLTVTPALRLANGAETSLLPVTIKPQEVKSVDIDAAIAAAAASQLVGTYGSVVLRYRSPSSANLYAALMIRWTGHPVAFHIDAVGESQDFQLGSREGVWWLPNDTASDYLILTNQGGNALPLTLSLYDAVGRESKQKVLLGPREVARYSVRNLLQTAQVKGTYGGIKISTPSHAGSLDTLHFLFDEKAAFSAILKMFDNDQNSKLEQRDFAKTGVWTLHAPMLALSNPDPALAFPPGTILHPQLLVHNATNKRVDAALRFVWRADKQVGKATGPALRLNPNETRLVDVAALQTSGVLPKEAHWSSVILTTNGSPDGVVAVAASYDETFRYGAQTPFSDQLSQRWEGGMWEYDSYHSSIITAGNGGTKPTRAAFTIFYNQGTEKYELEQTLQPEEQMWIDVGKLIREHVPDKNGKMLPTDLTMGAYEFRDLTNKGVGTLFEGKVIYDKTYGHVAYGCAYCCGYNNVVTTYDPLGIPLSFTADNGVRARYVCTSTLEDVSGDFSNWSTVNTAIATATAYGTHTGVSIGSTTSNTHGDLESNIRTRQCPITTFYPSGGANVMKLSCPSSVTRAGSATCSVSSAPTGATFSGWKFTDSSSNTVTSANTGSSWSGTMVTSGTVSVTVSAGGKSTPLSAGITVNNRSWHTAAASPGEVPNGTFLILPVPPQNTGDDSGLGESQWHYVLNQGFLYSTINDNGPNQGYTYWPSNQIFSTWNYQYEINPDLENTGSTFYQAQCGNYNASTKPNGFISGTNLLTQTNRHEWNSSTQSHYVFYSNSLNLTSNNPGDFLEPQIATPGANLQTFANNSTSGINNRLATVSSDSLVQPYPVNDDSSGNFLGNINYAPYTSCQ